MTITIEKGAAPKGINDSIIKALSEMEVGDSFTVDAYRANSIRTTACLNFHKHTDKFFRSTVKGQPMGKVKFWRER